MTATVQPRCFACGDRANKRIKDGRPACDDCYAEIELGRVGRIHNINFGFGGRRGGPLEDSSPYQDNAIRDMEDGS